MGLTVEGARRSVKPVGCASHILGRPWHAQHLIRWPPEFRKATMLPATGGIVAFLNRVGRALRGPCR
jgi:hypothetical protein